MRTLDILPIAYRNLNRRRTRTLLTSLAVFIGIFLLTIMISLGLGVEKWLLNMITSQMEYTRITVAQEGTLSGGNFAALGSGEGTLVGEEELEKKTLSQSAIEAISQIEHVTQVQPMIMMIPKSAMLEGQTQAITSIAGGGWDLVETDAYVKEVIAGDMNNWTSASNNVLVTQHFTQGYNVEPKDIIGKTLEINFLKSGSSGFGPMQQVGLPEEIKITQTIVAVIDVGEDSMNYVIPLDRAAEISAIQSGEITKEEYLEQVGYMMVYVNTDDLANTNSVAEKIREMDFDALTVDDIISMINTIFVVIQAVLAIFGLIALIVASIGIINTMIMSIYERTREIGVMKAIGAKNRDIKIIFVTEAALIGFLGGFIGVIAGYFGAFGLEKGLNVYLTQIGESSQSFFTFPWELAIGSLLFATLIGLLAGLSPASKAAKLDPIDALRYE